MEVDSLIWIIYLADVLPVLSFVVITVSLIVLLSVLASLLCNSYLSTAKKWAIAISSIVFFLGFLIPSAEAIYLMGGVKYGSKVVGDVHNSERYKKVMKILDAKLDELANQIDKKE